MAKLKTRFGKFVQWFKSNPSTSKSTTKTSTNENALATTVMDKPADLAGRKLAKETPMQQMQKGYNEMIDLMGAVRGHMELQSQRSERLLNVLEGLPQALQSLPETSRNQTRTLQAIQTNLEQQGKHNAKLSDALNGLSTTTSQHQHAMTAVGKQLDAGHQRSEQMLNSFSSLSTTLDRMGESNEASTGLLRQIAEQESKASQQVRELFTRNQKHMTTMSVVSWSLALIALTVAGYVAVSVTRLASQPVANNAITNADNSPAQPQTTPNPPAEDKITPAKVMPASIELETNLGTDAAPNASPTANPDTTTTTDIKTTPESISSNIP
jgi:hypothetical protein